MPGRRIDSAHLGRQVAHRSYPPLRGSAGASPRALTPQPQQTVATTLFLPRPDTPHRDEEHRPNRKTPGILPWLFTVYAGAATRQAGQSGLVGIGRFTARQRLRARSVLASASEARQLLGGSRASPPSAEPRWTSPVVGQRRPRQRRVRRQRCAGNTGKGDTWFRATLTVSALVVTDTKTLPRRSIPPIARSRGHVRAIAGANHSIPTAAWQMLQTGGFTPIPPGTTSHRERGRLTKRLLSQFEAPGHNVTLEPQRLPPDRNLVSAGPLVTSRKLRATAPIEMPAAMRRTRDRDDRLGRLVLRIKAGLEPVHLCGFSVLSAHGLLRRWG